MQRPIFPNSSYAICVGADPSMETLVSEAMALHRLRVYFCSSSSELSRLLGIMKRVTGIMLCSDRLQTQEMDSCLKLAGSHSIPTLDIGSHTTPKKLELPQLQTVIDEFLAQLVPVGLKEKLLSAALAVLPRFLGDVRSFESVLHVPPGFDRQINFSIVAGNLVGNFSVRFKSAEIIASFSHGDDDKSMDSVREALNQCLGLVTQALVEAGINAKIGLPTTFDISKIPGIQTLVYFPSANIMDSTGRICLSLGFYNLANEPLFNLSKLGTEKGSIEVEFL